MPLPKLKNSLSVKLALYSVLQICELVFLLWQLHPKKLSKSVSETCAKWSQFGKVSETQGLAFLSLFLYLTKGFFTSLHTVLLSLSLTKDFFPILNLSLSLTHTFSHSLSLSLSLSDRHCLINFLNGNSRRDNKKRQM